MAADSSAAGLPPPATVPLPAVNLRRRGARVVSNNERGFVVQALQQEQRIDGRGLFDFRKVRVSFGRDDGAAEVELGGQTRVLGVAECTLAQPYPDRGSEGTLAIFADVSPMAHEGGGGGAGGDEAVELARIVDRSLRESRAVDMEALCVVTGRLVWAVRLELHVLDHGGNVVDCASLAALAALMSLRIPVVTVGEVQGPHDQPAITVHPPEERDPQPLILHLIPVTCTFAFFNDGTDVVLDPSGVEECAMGGRFSVAVAAAAGDVCALQKPGGLPVLPSQLMRAVRIAAAKAPELEKILRDAVAALDAQRAERKVRRWRRPLEGAPQAPESAPVRAKEEDKGGGGRVGLGAAAERHLRMEVEEDGEEDEAEGEDEEEEEEEDEEGGEQGDRGDTREEQREASSAAACAGSGQAGARADGNGKAAEMFQGLASAWLEDVEGAKKVTKSPGKKAGKGQGTRPHSRADPFDNVTRLIESSSGHVAVREQGRGSAAASAEDDNQLTLKAAVKRKKSARKSARD